MTLIVSIVRSFLEYPGHHIDHVHRHIPCFLFFTAPLLFQAGDLAAWNHPKMLILDSPYYSFQYQIRRFGWWLPLRWILRYKIPTYKYLQKINCPVYIIHGDKDFLISYEQGVRLKHLVPDKVTLITIKGGRHNNLHAFESYHKALYKILNT